MAKLNRDAMYNISEALKQALVAGGEDIDILDGAPRMLTEIEKSTLTRDEEREYINLAAEAMRQSNEDGLCRMVVMTPEDRKFVVLTEVQHMAPVPL